MKIIFTLPQLRDHSYISVVNRLVHLNQSVRNRSLSTNSSLVKNSSISYDHVKTSSPIKEESKVPQFNPPLEQNAKDNSILQGANHKVRIDARVNSSISSPQIKQLEWQNDGVNSRHSSGIGSPWQNLSKQVNSPNLGESGKLKSQIMGQPSNFKSPNEGEPSNLMSQLMGQPSNFKSPNLGEPSNFKSPSMGQPSNFESPNMGHPSNFKFPDMGKPSNFKSPNMGNPSNFKFPSMGKPSNFESPSMGQPGNYEPPSMGETSNHCAPHMGEQGNFQAPKMGNRKGISRRYLANFNIFLKRKDDVQVEVERLLLSSKNEQTQPSTLKLMATDLKSKLTSTNTF